MTDHQGSRQQRSGDAAAAAVDETTGPAAESMAHPLTPIAISHVELDDAFWSPKRHTWQSITIRDVFRKFDHDGALNNFDRVRDGRRGGHAGPPWYDGLIYEMIRAASDFLAASPDPALDEQVDGYIERIAAAAESDPTGYVNTYTQLEEPDHRWGLNGGFERWQHEVYNAGALVEAGIHHYRATGKPALLTVAVRLANLMCDLMGPPPKRQIVPSHSLPEEALVELYLLVRDDPDVKAKIADAGDEGRYLRLAEFWIENRGHHVGQPDWAADGPVKAEQFIRGQGYGDGRPSWGAYAQDHKPVLEQEAIEGHAVRATLLCAGLAAAARVNGRHDYRAAARRLWTNMVTRRMYITGGTGSFADEEKFGADYVLPNDGYLETCAAVGAGLFHRNMHLLFGHARYIDELERVLFNGALSGVSLKGDAYTYENPLEAGPGHERWAWHRCPCCPPMFLKLMGALPGYIYAHDTEGIYVNLFVGSRVTIHHRGRDVGLRQTTRYPWDGRVTIAVDPERSAVFAVSVRIPAWCRGASLSVNGALISDLIVSRGYARVRRRWEPGDSIELVMEMPVERVKAHPRVQSDAGRIALTRGPIVYCIESVDNADPVEALALPPQAPLTAEFRADMLDGVVILQGTAQSVSDAQWGDVLYRPVEQCPEPLHSLLVAIPYYARANRGPAAMRAWIPEGAGNQSAPVSTTHAYRPCPSSTSSNPSA